jgi:hypothetical protein
MVFGGRGYWHLEDDLSGRSDRAGSGGWDVRLCHVYAVGNDAALVLEQTRREIWVMLINPCLGVMLQISDFNMERQETH